MHSQTGHSSTNRAAGPRREALRTKGTGYRRFSSARQQPQTQQQSRVNGTALHIKVMIDLIKRLRIHNSRELAFVCRRCHNKANRPDLVKCLVCCHAAHKTNNNGKKSKTTSEPTHTHTHTHTQGENM